MSTFRDTRDIYSVKIISQGYENLQFTSGKYAVKGMLKISHIIKNIDNFYTEGAATIDIFTKKCDKEGIEIGEPDLWQSIPRNICIITYNTKSV